MNGKCYLATLLVFMGMTFLFADTTAFSQQGANLSPQQVMRSIERGRQFLIKQQNANGSWTLAARSRSEGMTSIAVLALINTGLKPDHPSVAKGLKYLRSIRDPDPRISYDLSLLLMALASANERAKDSVRVFQLAKRLEAMQIKSGSDKGAWGYSKGDKSGDRSCSQYAILALREAAYFGSPVSKNTWQRAYDYYKNTQNADGGWGYRGGPGSRSTGSMTVAGIASMSICERFLVDTNETNADGTPICCTDKEPDPSVERGKRWMARNFSTRSNPGDNQWWLYYIYGLERAGRLTGQRYFGRHDWYPAGALTLIDKQSAGTGGWKGANTYESDPVLATSFSLLFLSKGLAPVLVNKVKYGPRNINDKDQVIGNILE